MYCRQGDLPYSVSALALDLSKKSRNRYYSHLKNPLNASPRQGKGINPTNLEYQGWCSRQTGLCYDELFRLFFSVQALVDGYFPSILVQW